MFDNRYPENFKHLVDIINDCFKEIIELPPWEAYRLSDDLEITIIPTDISNSSPDTAV